MEESNNNDPIYKVDPQITTENPNKNWFSAHLVLGIIFLVAVAAAIVAGIFYWQTVSQIPPPSTTPVHKVQTDPTANWKIYTNSQYGFEFKYPSDWSVETTNSNQFLFISSSGMDAAGGCSDCGLITITKTTYKSVSEYKSYLQNSPAISKNDINFNSYAALDVSNSVTPTVGCNYHHIDLVSNNYIFDIQHSNCDGTPVPKLVDQILSTFKFTATATSGSVYMNDQYGFSIDLPDSWTGYTILASQWTGTDVASGKVTDQGPIITLRHPLWTQANPREDMPIMVFTPAQWAQIVTEKMAVGAAPIPPSSLAQNSKYIFALPARYNYDYKIGWQEVDALVHTLKAYEPK